MGKFNLMTVYEICHLDKDGNILWKKENIKNTLHYGGEEFILKAAFDPSSISIPSNFYLGLDARTSVLESDNLNSLILEPNQNGYTRQAVNSSGGFSVSFSGGVFKAVSSVVKFSAAGGAWGPVKNLFLATSSGNSGLLITTSSLGSSKTVNVGESITMRIGLSLKEC